MAAPRPSVDPRSTAAETTLYETLLIWTCQYLGPQGYGRPFCKRVAVLLAGLLAGERATLSRLAECVHGLALSSAQEPSILRRLQRLLDDVRLDPSRLLADLLGAVLPSALQPLVAAHASAPNRRARRTRPRGAPQTPWLRLIRDETSVADRLHVLVIGVAIPGLVLPLAVRCWRQGVAQPEKEYWTQLSHACWQIQALLPAVLRSQVLLVADRAYGVPQVIDLCEQLGWAYALRVQGQVRVRLARQASLQAVRTLVPRPGTSWYGGGAFEAVNGAAADAAPRAVNGAEEGVWAFRKAGWRHCHLAAAWAQGQAEPWLVVTSLPGTPERLRE